MYVLYNVPIGGELESKYYMSTLYKFIKKIIIYSQ